MAEAKKATETKVIKAKVAITYRDKNDKVLHKAGEVVTVNSDRFKELNTGKKRLIKL